MHRRIECRDPRGERIELGFAGGPHRVARGGIEDRRCEAIDVPAAVEHSGERAQVADAIVTIAPLVRLSARSAARANRNVAVRLVSIALCHSASERVRSFLRIMMPAFDTTASSRPN